MKINLWVISTWTNVARFLSIFYQRFYLLEVLWYSTIYRIPKTMPWYIDISYDIVQLFVYFFYRQFCWVWARRALPLFKDVPLRTRRAQFSLPQIRYSVVEGHFAQDCACAEWLFLWHVRQTHSGFHKQWTYTEVRKIPDLTIKKAQVSWMCFIIVIDLYTAHHNSLGMPSAQNPSFLWDL